MKRWGLLAGDGVCANIYVCACVYGGVSLQVCVGRIKERASVSVGSWYSGREDVSALSVCVHGCKFVCVCVHVCVSHFPGNGFKGGP